MEYKAVDHFTKEISDRTVTGLAAITGNIDGGNDVIHKGAFKKTIKENNGRIRHLWMHDPWQPPTAVIKGLKEVGLDDLPDELKARYPDATGGLEVAREYLNTARGDEILEGIRKQAINQMSIGYDTVPGKSDIEELETNVGAVVTVRNLREIRLWDTSDVTWGMNQATVASKSNVENHLMELVELTDAIKAGRVLSSRNLQRLKDALTVLSEILEAAEPLEEETDDDEKAIQPIVEVVETLPQKALTVEGIVRRLEIARRQATLYGV